MHFSWILKQINKTFCKTKNLVCSEAHNWMPPNTLKLFFGKMFYYFFFMFTKKICFIIQSFFYKKICLKLSNSLICCVKAFWNQRYTWFLLNVNIKPRFSEVQNNANVKKKILFSTKKVSERFDFKVMFCFFLRTIFWLISASWCLTKI